MASPRKKKTVLAIPGEPIAEPPAIVPVVITHHGTVESPLASRASYVLYSSDIAEAAHDLFLAGMSLHKISQLDGMPSYGSLLRWYKDTPEFRALIDGARATRALHHEEEALRAADEVTYKDDVPAARLKFDAHVWAAEVSDPSKYGKKTMLSGDPDRPLVFQISTGVPERLDPKVIELNADGTVKEVTIEKAASN